MKHKFLASLLALSMLLGLLPGAALAAENDEDGEEPVVYTETGEEPEGDPADVPDEPDEAPVEGEDDTTVIVPEQEEPVVEEPTAVKQLQARIDVLPDAEKLEEMDGDELALVYAEVDAIYDAIKGLTAEEAEALDVTALEEAAAFFTRQIMTLDEEEDTPNSCGDNVKWTFNEGSGTLTISGEGAMEDYASGQAPWYAKKASIKEIVIEDCVTHIGSYAFRDLNAVSGAVSLPASVKSLGEGAFRFCTMSSIDLNQVETIGPHAIRQCSNLTSVTIPGTVKEVGIGAFYGTGSADGFTVTVDGAKDTAFLGTDFTTSKLTSITFKNCSGIELVQQTFSNCANLTTVTYENCSDFTMGNNIFSGCTQYVGKENGGTLEIPACVTKLTGNPLPGGTITFAEGCPAGSAQEDAVYDATGTVLLIYTGTEESFTVPAKVKEIAPGAFQNNTTVKRVTLPDGLNTIGASAFSNCSALSEVNIPGTVQEIGTSAFSGAALSSVTIPESITEIPNNLFQNCTQLENVIFEASLTSIGGSAFNGCSGLKTIDLQDSLETIGANAFTASGLTEVKIPDCYVGNAAFSNCKSLTKVEISSGATCNPASQSNLAPFYDANGNTIEELIYHPDTWGNKWFTSLSKAVLTSVKFTGKIAIADSAFKDFSELTTAEFPNAVTIGDGAFYNTGLTSVVIPESVTNVGKGAFAYCTSLKSIDVGSNAVPANVDASMHSPFYASGGSIETAVFRQKEVSNKWLNGVTVVSYADNQSNKTNYSIKSVVFTNGQPPTSNNFTQWSDLIVAVLDGGELSNYTLSAGTAPTPTKNGCSFAGWATSSDGEPQKDIAFEKQKVYYAKWTESSYTVDDKLEFETFTYGENPASQEISATLKEGEAAEEGSFSASIDSENFTVSLENGKITVTPANNLNAGSYTATVTVTTPDHATHNVTVSLTVNKATLPAPELSGCTATATSITVTAPKVPTGASKVQYSIGNDEWQDSGEFSGLKAGTSYSVIAKFVADNSGNYADSASSEPLSVKTSTAPSTTPNTPGNGGGSHSSSSSSSSSSTYPVTVDSTKNGTVSVSPKNAKKDATVTLTVKANSGYELDDLTVTDKNGKNIKVTEGKNGKFTFTMPAGKVTVEASFAKVEEQSGVTFRDVPASAYYYDAVEWAVEKGITSGTSATTFSPDAACTRAQAVTFLWRAAGSPAPKSSVNPFTDVPASAYYYDAVLWAVENGITAGTSATTFSPDASCTRAQIVTFLYRAYA